MAPWKCLDCGVWWAGLEHRCQPMQTGTQTPTWPYQPLTAETGGFTVRCTCQPNALGSSALCPIHGNVTITYPTVSG